MLSEDKIKYVAMMVNNIGYINKYPIHHRRQITIKHLLDFLSAYPSFNVHDAIQRLNDDSFFSFIELDGFIQTGGVLSEMYIGMPKTYPQHPPAFLLSFNRAVHLIYGEENLKQRNLIAFQKNQTLGDECIRLRLPVCERQWDGRTKTLKSTFSTLIQIINRPPLLMEKQQRRSVSKPVDKIPSLSLENSWVNEVIKHVSQDGEKISCTRISLIDANIQLDYLVCREKFFQSHLPILKSKLSEKVRQIDQESKKISQRIDEMNQKKTCESMLQISQRDKQKIQILSEQSALKEAEVKIRRKIEEDEKVKFCDYKKLMKILYQRMFDNQTKRLTVI